MRSLLGTLTFLCLAAAAQTPKPTFEVASIKPATPLGPLGMRADRKGGPGTNDPGMYTCRNCPLSWVVSEAYELMPFEFVAPNWLDNTRFDFLGKIPAGATKESFRAMLQNLLADRFQLAVHREKRDMTVYELTVAKNGPLFHESTPKDAPQADAPQDNTKRDKDGFPILAAGTMMAVIPGHARLRSDNQPISWFARMLAGQMQGPVIDSTGLQGKYDFTVSWAYVDNSIYPGSLSAGASEAPSAEPLDPYRPAFMRAIQSQLGLKLEQKKGKAEVLVVDHMEKVPTEN